MTEADLGSLFAAIGVCDQCGLPIEDEIVSWDSYVGEQLIGPAYTLHQGECDQLFTEGLDESGDLPGLRRSVVQIAPDVT